MPIQAEVLIPQKVTVLPNVPVVLTMTGPATFAKVSSNIPGGPVITPNPSNPNQATITASPNLAEWGECLIKGELADGNFGLCEIYFLVPMTISPVGEE